MCTGSRTNNTAFLLQNHQHGILWHNSITLKHAVSHFRRNVQTKPINYYTHIITLPTTLKQALLLLGPVYVFRSFLLFLLLLVKIFPITFFMLVLLIFPVLGIFIKRFIFSYQAFDSSISSLLSREKKKIPPSFSTFYADTAFLIINFSFPFLD